MIPRGITTDRDTIAIDCCIVGEIPNKLHVVKEEITHQLS